MDLVHLHLILNHVPVIGIPIAMAFLLHGLLKGNEASQKFALFVLVVVCLAVLPVYFTGEPAEDTVEKIPGVFKSMIHDHEESAEVSLTLTLVAGAFALLSLWLMKIRRCHPKMIWFVLILSFLSFASLAYTANLGGMVRHSEIRTDTNPPAE